jgi:hypothetical protein
MIIYCHLPIQEDRIKLLDRVISDGIPLIYDYDRESKDLICYEYAYFIDHPFGFLFNDLRNPEDKTELSLESFITAAKILSL